MQAEFTSCVVFRLIRKFKCFQCWQVLVAQAASKGSAFSNMFFLYFCNLFSGQIHFLYYTTITNKFLKTWNVSHSFSHKLYQGSHPQGPGSRTCNVITVLLLSPWPSSSLSLRMSDKKNSLQHVYIIGQETLFQSNKCLSLKENFLFSLGNLLCYLP